MLIDLTYIRLNYKHCSFKTIELGVLSSIFLDSLYLPFFLLASVEISEQSSNSGIVCYIHFYSNALWNGMNPSLLYHLLVNCRVGLTLALGSNFKKRKTLNYKLWRSQWETTPLFSPRIHGNS